MSLTFSLVLALVAASPMVELNTLAGAAQAGPFERLTATHLVLRTGASEVQIPLADIVDARFSGAGEAVANSEPTLAVALVDGSRFACSDVAVAGRQAVLKSPLLGDLSLPFASLGSVRFAPFESKVEAAWSEFVERETKQDLVVVRKGDILDHYAGVIGDIDEQTVKFVVDGEEIPVKREKVFGLVFARPAQDNSGALCRLSVVGGDVLFIREIVGDVQGLDAELLTGARVQLPVGALAALDFSGGKILYLSQVEPREVKYTPFFDIVWKYRRDSNLDGGPLRLGGKVYSRGLAIHSRTLLSYRIGGDYRRFQAVMGIDQAVERMGLDRVIGRDVHVVISGDGNKLFEADVRGADPPQELDIDVTNVRDLEILVDFGGDQLDIADHLDLADAKVIK